MFYRMSRAAAPAPASAAQGAALATLGMVALLIAFVTERLLPRCIGHAGLQAPILRLHAAMGALALLAWHQIEVPEDEEAALEAMGPAALAMREALTALVAAMARLRPRGGPPKALRPSKPATRAASGRAEAPRSAASAGLARDGPLGMPRPP